MKAKHVKTTNTHMFAVRLPKTLVKRVNAARISQGLEWAPLLCGLFERYLDDYADSAELKNSVESGGFSKLKWSGSGGKQ